VKPEKALSWQRIFLFYYSFSLFAFMPFRVFMPFFVWVQRKRIKRKGSQSLAASLLIRNMRITWSLYPLAGYSAESFLALFTVLLSFVKWHFKYK